MTGLSHILKYKIVAIIRGIKPADVLPIAEALRKGGIQTLEVTLNSPGALGVIENLSKKFQGSMLVGAGTVLDVSSARQAIYAGAQFLISPSVDVETIKYAKENKVVSIPGAYTPTEIVTAYKAGADIIKVFPVSTVSYFKDIRAPLSHIPMMPTGGVDLDNIKAYRDAGAVAFGVGSALIHAKAAIDDQYLAELTNKASRFVKALTES